MHFYFLGLDVHKQVIVYCQKKMDATIVMEGKVHATREALAELVKQLPSHWQGGLEDSLSSHWIYRLLEPHAAEMRMGNPSRLKRSAGKNKSDELDAPRGERISTDRLNNDAGVGERADLRHGDLYYVAGGQRRVFPHDDAGAREQERSAGDVVRL